MRSAVVLERRRGIIADAGPTVDEFVAVLKEFVTAAAIAR
jgi:hypothetical protein